MNKRRTSSDLGRLTAVAEKKGQSFGLLLGQLRPYLRTLGMVSLLLVGIGMLLEAASAYMVLGYAFYQGYNTGAGGYLWGTLATLLLLISLAVLFAARSIRRGSFPRITILLLFLSAISLFMEALGTLISPTGGSVTVTALTIAAGVILLAALFFTASESTWVLLTAAILGLVSVMLLMVRIGDLGGQFAQVGGSSLSSYLLSGPTPQGTAVAGVASFFASVGIVGTTSLVYIAYLTAAIGLMFWAVLRDTRLAQLAWVTALVGFFLYGIDMAWGNASALAIAETGPVDWTTAALPFTSAIVLEVASFVIMASTAVGLVIHGQDLRLDLTQEKTEKQAQAKPTQAVEVKVCPHCGAEIPIDSVYCKKCGTQLGSNWFSAGQVRTGKVCIICGAENPSDHDYCKKCGSKLAES
jgi:ribosomal protein L40E